MAIRGTPNRFAAPRLDNELFCGHLVLDTAVLRFLLAQSSLPF